MHSELQRSLFEGEGGWGEGGRGGGDGDDEVERYKWVSVEHVRKEMG